MTVTHSYGDFLAEFDNYVAARVQMRKAPEGSAEERLAINNCVDQWARVISARESLHAHKLTFKG